jgi:predicted amidohydrolase YtcJ
MSQKTIYHNEKIGTNSTPYFAEAMAVGNGKVLATGTSSRRYTTVTKSASSRIAAVT